MADVLHRPLYTADILVNALNSGDDRPLLHLVDGPTLSVRQVREETSRFVQALASFGIAKGSRVGLISANRPEVIHVSHAASILGAVYTPLHPMAGLADHLHALRDAGVELFVFDADRFGGRAAEIAREIPGLKLLAFGSSDLGPDLVTLAHRFTPQPLVAAEVGPHDLVRLGYSGGTTGKPKAIPSVQRIGITSLQIMMADWEWPTVPRVLSCAPLSHAGSAMFLPTLMNGGTLMVLPGFDPVAVMQAIQDHRINCMMLVPTMIYALLDHPRFDEFDLSSLETVFYGASAISPVRLKEAIGRIGPVFQQFYGQAEARWRSPSCASTSTIPNDLQRLASCGRPTPVGPRRAARQRGQPGARRRAGRDLRARPAGDGRLPRQPRADRRGLPRRLAAHRRRGGARSGRVPADRRPHQGHDRHRRVQRLPARDRGHHRRASGGLAGAR